MCMCVTVMPGCWRIDLMKQTRVIRAFNLFFSLLLSITNHHLFPAMSAAHRVQQHPVYVQAQNKATYYVNQLDKEVTIIYLLFFSPIHLTPFFYISSQSTLSSTPWSNVPKFLKLTPWSVLSYLLSFSIPSTLSLHPSQTSLAGLSLHTSHSRQLNHHHRTMTSSGSLIGSFLASSIS